MSSRYNTRSSNPSSIIYRPNGSVVVPMNAANAAYFAEQGRLLFKASRKKRNNKKADKFRNRRKYISPIRSWRRNTFLHSFQHVTPRNVRLLVNDLPRFLTPEKPRYNKVIHERMPRFNSDPTYVTSKANLDNYSIPRGFGDWKVSKFKIPSLSPDKSKTSPETIKQHNNNIPSTTRSGADYVIKQAALRDKVFSTPTLKRAFLNCTRDPKTGIPLVLKGRITDGANIIGKGQYGLNIAPDSVNEIGHLHDYLYDKMGKIDPLMNATNQEHTDFAFMKESFKAGHPIWGVLAYLGLKTAEVADSVFGTSLIDGREATLSKEQFSQAKVLRSNMNINQASGSNSNRPISSTSNSNLNDMQQMMYELDDPDSENIIANMVMPPAAAAGGFVVPHLILQPYATDFDAIRILESKFEPVKTALYCQRVFKGDDDYVIKMIKTYPKII